mmetsp:Transcript_47736/g.92305  ORF Transcript_47736/g.92305 Transcript_47736/m.92305 type:complete len:210 (-) Transcript_47736:42-671(-)
MVAEVEVGRVLETIPYETLGPFIVPLGTCPACKAIFPTCLGIVGAWEHICKWEDAHGEVRDNVAEIVKAELSNERKSLSNIDDNAVRTLLDLLGFQVESGMALPSLRPRADSGAKRGSASSSTGKERSRQDDGRKGACSGRGDRTDRDVDRGSDRGNNRSSDRHGGRSDRGGRSSHGSRALGRRHSPSWRNRSRTRSPPLRRRGDRRER